MSERERTDLALTGKIEAIHRRSQRASTARRTFTRSSRMITGFAWDASAWRG